jgi:hypothetical protein
MQSTMNVMCSILNQEIRMIEFIENLIYNETDKYGVDNWKLRMELYKLRKKSESGELLTKSDFKIAESVFNEIKTIFMTSSHRLKNDGFPD